MLDRDLGRPEYSDSRHWFAVGSQVRGKTAHLTCVPPDEFWRRRCKRMYVCCEFAVSCAERVANSQNGGGAE